MMQSFRHVLIPELNLGQLRLLLRGRFLVDAKGLNKVRGQPFTITEVVRGARAITFRRLRPTAKFRLTPTPQPLPPNRRVGKQYEHCHQSIPQRSETRGLCQRPGNPLVPRVRGLFDPRADEKSPRQARRRSQQDGLYLWDRMQQPVSLLFEHLRIPQRSTAGRRPLPAGFHWPGPI